MHLNLVISLHTLPANPKPGVALFLTSLIIFYETTGITQQASSPQPLPCGVEADTIHKMIFISSLELREEVGVI